MKIIGIKKAVQDIKGVPKGFHVEVWSEKNEKGDVEVWTSEYLSQNSWTINHPASHKRLDGLMSQVYMMENGEVSVTEQIRRAVAEVYGN